MNNQPNTSPKEKKTQSEKPRPQYEKPVVTRHGNLKKITALSFQPPE